MGLLGHMVVLFLVFKGISILFSIVAVSIYIPTNSARGFPFLHILPTIIVCSFLMMAILIGVASLVAQLVKSLPAMWETWVQSLAWEDPLEEEMATESSTLA